MEVHGFTHTWSDPRLTDHAREYLATFGSYLVALPPAAGATRGANGMRFWSPDNSRPVVEHA